MHNKFLTAFWMHLLVVNAVSRTDSESLLSCEAFVGAQATVKSFLREALENARASVEQYLP